jgi:hypothetical protein
MVLFGNARIELDGPARFCLCMVCPIRVSRFLRDRVGILIFWPPSSSFHFALSSSCFLFSRYPPLARGLYFCAPSELVLPFVAACVGT